MSDSDRNKTKLYLQESLISDIQTMLEFYDESYGSKCTWNSYFENYINLYENFAKMEPFCWESISPPSDDLVIDYNNLQEPTDTLQLQSYLEKLIVVKLNGGLGTTMGCSGPKSLIHVRDNLSFLDITINQLEYFNQKYDVDIPLILMNSFNTDSETQRILPTYENYRTKIYTFVQSTYPRIDSQSHRPLPTKITSQPENCWYPPGHGDFYKSFDRSGLLNKFIKEKKEIAFISNIDNLGATIDFCLLDILLKKSDNPIDFLIETTNKTKSDTKGGTIITYNGQPRLLEIAQVPKKHEEDFKSINKFKIFNTNNIWINLKSLKSLSNKDINLDIIVNKKVISSGKEVIQLETAIGSGIKLFNNPKGVNVPRSRFLPVKNNSDLFLIQSNIYQLTDSGFKMNPDRLFQTTPYVRFTGECFQKVQDYLKRFSTIPDVLDLDHLTISGNVFIGANVTLKGTVIIIAQPGQRIDIPPGSILENKLVSGNLTILSN